MDEKRIDSFQISYSGLWKILIDKSLKKTDLMPIAGISSSTLAKMSKAEPVSMDVVGRICVALSCKVGDIIEIIY
jgi:putative transcriptional regulator